MRPTLQDLVDTLESLPPEDRQTYIEDFLAQIGDGDRIWEAAFEHPKSDSLLRKMADEARAEEQAGQTRPLSELLDRYRNV